MPGASKPVNFVISLAVGMSGTGDPLAPKLLHDRVTRKGFKVMAAQGLQAHFYTQPLWRYAAWMARSSSTKRTKAQHYVPRLHLRHFRGAAPKNMIWTYSKSRGTARPSRIEETGYQRNFYSVLDADGEYRDEIDNLLQGIESSAASPYRQLLAGVIPEGQARADFAVFVATCFTRSPAFIRAYAEATARSMQLELRLNAQDLSSFNRLADEMEQATGECIEDREEAFRFLNDPTRYTIGISEKAGLKAIGVADDLTPLLMNRRWNVAVAHGDTFITSDNPVYRWVPPETIHPIYGCGGFKNARAEVSFPLSSSMMLIIGDGLASEGQIFVGSEDVQNLNLMRAANAEEFLYANSKDDRFIKLAADFRDQKPRMTIGHRFATDVVVDVKR